MVKPITSKDFNSRGQVDLIDMQSMPDGEFKWLLVYQDHLTKFVVLRALKNKIAAEAAEQLVDIFCLIDAPHILQSDNGREFTANVVKRLPDLFPGLVIVHGQPRHPQSQGSVERYVNLMSVLLMLEHSFSCSSNRSHKQAGILDVIKMSRKSSASVSGWLSLRPGAAS